MEIASNQKTYALFSTPANQKLAANLEQEGAKVFRFAPVTTHKIRFEENSEIVRNRLHEFDWLIFPEIFAVDHFLEILEAGKVDLFELDTVQIFALGEAVADRLRFVQIHSDVIPHSLKKRIILSTLLNYLSKTDLKEVNFLIPGCGNFETEFKTELIGLGANVTEIAVYQAQLDEKDKTANLKALLKGGAIDEFIFDLPEDVLSLKYYLAGEVPAEILSEVKISGTNETAIQALRENDLTGRVFQIKKG